MPRSLSRTLLAVVVGATGLALAACGSEQEATTTSTAAPVISENPSAPVVGGPKPASPTASEAEPEAGHTQCGTTNGPDGSLRIVILEGRLSCDTAKQIATEYSPKIATGAAQTVSGWSCGPSQTAGVLASCSNDGKAFGLVP